MPRLRPFDVLESTLELMIAVIAAVLRSANHLPSSATDQRDQRGRSIVADNFQNDYDIMFSLLALVLPDRVEEGESMRQRFPPCGNNGGK